MEDDGTGGNCGEFITGSALCDANVEPDAGIRLALGAQPSDILMLAFRPGVALTLAGIGAGLGVSVGLMRAMSSLLFGVSASDPLIFATVPAALVIVALSAGWVPARRATRISPAEALRS